MGYYGILWEPNVSSVSIASVVSWGTRRWQGCCLRGRCKSTWKTTHHRRQSHSPHLPTVPTLSSRLYPDSRSISDCDTQLSFFGLVCDHCTIVRKTIQTCLQPDSDQVYDQCARVAELVLRENKLAEQVQVICLWFHVAFVTFLPSIPVDIIRVISCYTCESSWVGHGLRKQDKASQWWR